jgi:predicted nucleic-acid-binding protein
MRTDKLLIQDIQLVWKALEAFKETKADFADCLLGQRNLQAGCQYTETKMEPKWDRYFISKMGQVLY